MSKIDENLKATIDPTETEGTNMTRSGFSDLSPYILTTKEGYIFENFWQFSKLYPSVPRSKEKYSRYSDTVIWDHPAEWHVAQNGDVLPAYLEWRKKGFSNKYPVRYPRRL